MIRKYSGYGYIVLLLAVLFLASCSGGGGGGGFIILTRSATLSWTAPTQYNDGSPLTPAGFKIHYGTASGIYTATLNVPNPAATSYAVSGLTLGKTYYFVVTTFDSSGVESAVSSEVSKPL